MSKEFPGDKFKITKNEDIFAGPNSQIDSVNLSAGKHSVDLLRKKVKGYPIEFMDGPKEHTELKKRGYPVFPTYRYDVENQMEYITDLRRGGTHRVVDFCNPAGNPPVYISNIEELEEEVKKLVEKSANDGLIINEPNIFFDVEVKSGIAKVLLGDLREIGYERFYEGPRATREEVFEHNQMILKGHMDRLKAIATESPVSTEEIKASENKESKNFAVEKYPAGNGFIYELHFATQEEAEEAVKSFWDTREGSELTQRGLKSGMLKPGQHQITDGDRTQPNQKVNIQKHPDKPFVVQFNGNTSALSQKGEDALRRLGFIE